MIHQYKLNGYDIVLDINSGSVHCVDDVLTTSSVFLRRPLTQGRSRIAAGSGSRLWHCMVIVKM